MAGFRTVANVGDIPAGEGRTFYVHGTLVGVFHIDGHYFAINDVCPHMGASLAAGAVDGDCVICPWHSWRFCIRDGTWLDNPRSVMKTDSYPVRLEGEEIQVQVP